MGRNSEAATTATFGTDLFMGDEPIADHEAAPEDRVLLRRIRQGETERFADLIRRHQSHVSRIVTRRVPADRVEEVVHDVFVRAYFGLAGFSESVSFDHWLAGIAVRTCYDFWRARAREAPPVSSLTEEHHRWIEHALAAESMDAFQEQARRREAAEILEWALGRLSPENRAVLTLVHLDGYPVRDAAKLLGWSVVNVKVRAHRARQTLRRLLRGILEGADHDAE
ncbi:MAG TPA: RNA polymerase sigma factor [Nitrospira sp.]|nr:RNA polymerase sigma factor [Nitrospira sp.]